MYPFIVTSCFIDDEKIQFHMRVNIIVLLVSVFSSIELGVISDLDHLFVHMPHFFPFLQHSSAGHPQLWWEPCHRLDSVI